MAKRQRIRPQRGTQTDAEFSIRTQLVQAQRELADVRGRLVDANRLIQKLKADTAAPAPQAAPNNLVSLAPAGEPCLKSRIAMVESDMRAHAKSHDQHVAEIMKLADRLRRVIYATGVDVETE